MEHRKKERTLHRYRMECTCRVALNARRLRLHGVRIAVIAPRLCMEGVQFVEPRGKG